MKNGTEKQIAWAESIKSQALMAIRHNIAKLENEHPDDIDVNRTDILRRRIEQVEQWDDAKWIIDNRNNAWDDGFDAMGRKIPKL